MRRRGHRWTPPTSSACGRGAQRVGAAAVKATPVIPRAAAWRNIDEAVASCLVEAGDGSALRFIEAIEKTFARIGRHPPSGSPRDALG